MYYYMRVPGYACARACLGACAGVPACTRACLGACARARVSSWIKKRSMVSALKIG